MGIKVGRLFLGVLFAVLILGPVQAVAQSLQPLPQPVNVDANGVDVTSGRLVIGSTDLAIGPDDHRGLQSQRYWSGTGWRMLSFPVISGSTTDPIVVFGGRSIYFHKSGTVFVAAFEDGSTLDPTMTYFTAADGTVVEFEATKPLAGGVGVTSLRRGKKITFPDGVEHTFTYQTVLYEETGTGTKARLISINSSTGYQIKPAYASNDPAGEELWLGLVSATALNNAVEYCSPTANTCTFVNSWPQVTFGYAGPLANNQPPSMTDPEGRTTAFAYTGPYLGAVTPPGAQPVTFTYSGGKVTGVTKGGGTWVYSYPSSTQTTVTDPSSNVRTTNYTSAGLVTSTVAGGQTTQFAYCTGTATCPAGLLQQVTMPENNKIIYEYDARGNVTKTIWRDKAGTVANDIVTLAAYPPTCTTSNRKICDKPTSTTDARGYRTDYTRSATHGGLTQILQPAPTGAVPIGSGARPTRDIIYTTTSSRYLTGPSTWTTGPAMHVVSTSTSCATASTCSGTPDERVTSIAYPSSSTPNNALPSSVTSKAGNNTLVATSTVTYDNYGRVKTIDGPLTGTADTAHYSYNLAGQTTGVISADPDGTGPALFPAVKTTYRSDGQVEYVQSGTVTAQSDAGWSSFVELERQTTWYDGHHRPFRQTVVANGTAYHVSDVVYDTASRPQCTIVRMDPAQWGNLAANCSPPQTTGPNGPDRVAYNHYDALGRVWKITTGYGTTAAADEQVGTFSNNGQLVTLTDAEGNKTTYEHDGHDRLVKTYFPHPTTDGFSSDCLAGRPCDYEHVGYDANGNVTSFRTRAGETLTLTYDNLNRLITKVVPNRAGNWCGLGAAPACDTHTRDVYYAYDLHGNMTVARYDGLSGQGITNALDTLGRLESTTTTMDGASRALGYQYDLAGNRTRLTYPDTHYIQYHRYAPGTFYAASLNGTASLFYTPRDAAGRVDSLHRWNTAAAGWTHYTDFTYDAVSRLASFRIAPAGSTYASTTSFTYNPVSQIASSSRTNDLFAWTGTPPAGIDRDYTSNGRNQYTAVDGTSHTYDANGNLTSDGTHTFVYDVENRLVRRTSAGSSTTLRYDPLGRLHEVADSVMGTTEFLHDGSDLVAEYNGSGILLRRYAHGTGAGDDPMVWFEGSGVADSARRYLYADERGSVVAVTDSNGAVTYVNTYDEYGLPNASGNDVSTRGRFRYTGQAWLPELGMYYYKARMYSPTLGRFMQTDPIGYGDGMNMYAYVGNDPVNAVDPTGKCTSLTTEWTRWVTSNRDTGEIVNATDWRPTGSIWIGCSNDLLGGPQYRDGPIQGGANGTPQNSCPVPAQTNAQRQRANSGDRAGYWQSRLDAGDPFARRALLTATNGDHMGRLANEWLLYHVRFRNLTSDNNYGYSSPMAEVRAIGVELMQAYSDQLGRGMTLDRWTNIHHAVFAEHGLGPSAFGATPFFGYGQTVMNRVAGIESCP